MRFAASSADARLVDTHCHLDAPEFDADAPPCAAARGSAGVVHCVIPAVAVANFDAVRELAHRQGDSYALGIHPLCTRARRDGRPGVLDAALAAHRDDPRLVAVGEIGLDYFVPGLDAAAARSASSRAAAPGARHGLPVMLHVRRSADQVLKHLRQRAAAGAASRMPSTAASSRRRPASSWASSWASAAR